MVENYLYDRCRYLGGSLKPFIYVLPKETTRIEYVVDSVPIVTNGVTAYVGKCEVRNIYATNIVKIEGFKTMLEVTETVDNRLAFATKVTLSMRENWGEVWISLLNQLKGVNAYVVVEDYNGVQYIQTPEFTSAFGYTYDFNTASNNGHIAEITYGCDANNPLVILNNRISPTQTIGNDCAYQDGGIRNFKMCPYQFAFIDNNVQTGQFTTITCTGGETMHLIEFTPKSFQFRQQFDGRNYQERLTFRIPLSDYKYYFRYNLVAFMQNRYAVTFETSQNNFIAAGFEFGFMPTFTVETSEGVEELNIIEITLQHTGQNSIFYCSDRVPSIVDSSTDVYVPVTNPIKDPITGVELSYFHCISKTEAIYTLVQLVTESGVPTDRYMCLQGYETTYEHLNIIGTYTRSADFGFELVFSNYDCATMDNCKFTKMTKEIYSFSSTGDYYDVHIQNPCPWTLNNIPSWIEASRLSGDGGTDYVVRFTCKQDATDNRIVAYGSLRSADNVSTIQFILEKKVDWINPVEHNITAKNQTVTSYVNLDYTDYEICDIPEGLTAEKIRGTNTVRINVPENPSDSETRTYIIKVCNILNGENGYIYINQDHLYVRWAEAYGEYICQNGNSYRKVNKYKGYTADNISILTDEYTTGALLIEEDPKCHYDGGDGDKYGYQWRDVDGTICIGTDLYSKQRKWETFDSGNTWNATNEYKENELIESSSSQCQNLPSKNYKFIIDETQYDCYGTASYYMECKWWSYDNVEWYKVTPEECQISTTLRKENDPQCGGGGIVPGYNEKWERSNETYCKEGFLFYLERKYISNDGGITWSETDEYREGNINSGVSCTDTQKGYAWRLDESTYVCDGYISYYVEKYYYYYVANPNVYILVQPMQTRRSSTVRQTNDPACGYVDPRKYRWNTNTGETICRGTDLYTREDYEYSEDDGETWHKTGQSRAGTLIEESSQTCESAEIQTKWEIDRTRWQCVGTTSYYYEIKYESMDGQNWIKTDETRVSPRTETLRLADDPACGGGGTIYRWVDDGDNYLCEYEDGEALEQTRWIQMPRSSWLCDGWNLHPIEKEQKTYNGGMTWSDTGVTRTSAEYERNAVECSQKTNCVFRNGAVGFKFDCDGNRTTSAMGIYLDFEEQFYNTTSTYNPKVRLITSSPQGNGWFTVTKTSHTVEGETVQTYYITIRSNNDTGTINCYWEVYNRADGKIIYKTQSFTITRNSQ